MTSPRPVPLLVSGMGAGGDGVARDDSGAAVFVPFALPGEAVLARPGARGRAELVSVEVASPERVGPPCRHFGVCGACAVQHWAEPAVSAWKAGRVAGALARAGFPDVAVAPAVAGPPGRRRRADFALRRRGGVVEVGFHRRGDREPFDLAECPVLDPRLVALLPGLREGLRGLPALRRAGSAVLNLLDTGPDLLLRTDGVPGARERARLAALGAELGLPRIAWGREGERGWEVAAQSGPVSLTLSGVAVSPPPGAFLQATPEGEAAIRAAVLAGLPGRMPARARVVELHAGLGTLSFALAARGRVEAFEGSAEAVSALSAAAGRAGLPLRATRRDLDRQPLSAAELRGARAVVLDPPRGGAAAVMPGLAACGAERVVHVSCDPAALARDAAVLARAGWRVEGAVAVDQFLWSAEVEAVVTFSRGGARGA